jgi:protoheme IX farnesyltransferase
MSMSAENLAAPASEGEAVPGSANPTSFGSLRAESRWRDYFALTRPRVLVLVLLSAPPAIALGGSWPDPVRLFGVLLGTILVGAGCGALNAWYERDRDAVMARTMDRPLPAGRLTPGRALAFGLAISTLGSVVLLVSGGALAAAIGLVALAHYVFVYTIWLKPRTPQAVVVGGVSGAIAPLIADAAVDGRVGVWGVVLFAMVFLWQPPHFWAIVLSRREEYEAAGFPMLPSVVGAAATRRQMLLWALALVPVSLLPCASGTIGPLYAATAVVGGGLFLASILHAMRLRTREADRRVFRVSIPYLALLFAAMLVECLPA